MIGGRLAPLLLLPLLAGCGLPPALTIASFAADGASYVATGKSVTDHGISWVSNEDCALHRPFIGKQMCKDPAVYANVPVEIGHNSVPRPGSPPTALAAAPPRDRYVTVGSFRERSNAAREQAHYAALGASIIAVEVQGKRYNRVVVGPLTGKQAAALKARVAAQSGVAFSG